MCYTRIFYFNIDVKRTRNNGRTVCSPRNRRRSWRSKKLECSTLSDVTYYLWTPLVSHTRAVFYFVRNIFDSYILWGGEPRFSLFIHSITDLLRSYVSRVSARSQMVVSNVTWRMNSILADGATYRHYNEHAMQVKIVCGVFDRWQCSCTPTKRSEEVDLFHFLRLRFL
jgi:hypothetical protein